MKFRTLKGSGKLNGTEYKKFVFDTKIINLCAWLTLIITYVTPYRIGDGGFILYGYPFAFFKRHPLNVSKVLLWSGSFDLLVFFIDLYLLYIVLKLLNRAFQMWSN